jgi:hypothetical protein
MTYVYFLVSCAKCGSLCTGGRGGVSIHVRQHKLTSRSRVLMKLITPRLVKWLCQLPKGLMRGSATDGLLGLRVLIPLGGMMSVFCECCALSGRGSLRWTDHSSRGKLRSMVCHCVGSKNLKNKVSVARVRLLCQTESQGIPYILCNLNVHYHAHKNPPLVPILYQTNPMHAPSHFLQRHFNIILPYTPRSSVKPVSFTFPHQSPARISPLSHTCYMPRPSHFS